MAALAISSAQLLLQIVIPLLEHLDIGKKVKPDIDIMTSWLGTTRAFIEEYDGREDQGRMLQDYTNKVREIVYDIEDVLDQFVRHTPPYFFHQSHFTRKARRIAHNVKHSFPLYGISDDIAGIMRRIDHLRSPSLAFSEASSSSRPPSPRRTSSSYGVGHHVMSPLDLLDREMVGYEQHKSDLIRLLSADSPAVVKLAVVGPSGSGKTTFVKNVYWKNEIRARFDCHAWVHVGRRHVVGDIFDSLVRQFGLWDDSLHSDLNHSRKLEKLRNFLRGKKYLVVLDDLWREIDQSYIENVSVGSRVIVTTTISSIASAIASSPNRILKLKGLDWLDGWRLFCKRAFPDTNGECPPELKDCSNRIVELCERLPSTIKAVGDALAHRRRLPGEWEMFLKNLGSNMKNSSTLNVVHNALSQRYMDLPGDLKCCFLYFSVFPEDSSIERGRLTRLWVAEGFARTTSTQTAEEVADDYLNELIHRNLIDVSRLDLDDRPRNFRVPSHVLKFIIHKCEEENFTSIFKDDNSSRSQKIRRLSVHHNHAGFPANKRFDCVRSIFLMRLLGASASDFNNYLSSMTLLRVFDFQAAPLTEFPKGFYDLTLVKYLCFRGTKIKTIPGSIKRLSHLETLDLKQTDVEELPKQISYLHKLRHLFCYKYCISNYIAFESTQGIKMHGGIDNLTSLQDLSLVKVDERGRILKDLQKLNQIRKLGLTRLRESHGLDLCTAVEGMKHLQTLDVCTFSKEEYLELGYVSVTNAPRMIQRLYLKGRLRRLPPWISSLDNLRKVGLMWSKLSGNPLPALGRLRNLMELQLVDCYVGEELAFEKLWFERLRNLVIEELGEVNTICIEDGAMADLRKLSLRKCPRLTMRPLGIENLRKVEELNLYDMDEKLVAGIGRRGEDYYAVKHIPVVNVFTLDTRHGSFKRRSI
ncbi:disease resistance protein RPM1-like [Andrographis paniculata]|uniref:disease resistance protein RPM1-like n=1 Tax=Andrographis paniculata TaxID=175694 RepID=UPI0021E6DF85|nr:disease resistance protein RPM1-like [Andrographis paniculata]